MKITIVYDNEACKEGLKADWGFSCLVEAHGKRMLFDTGANGRILLENMEKLHIDPATIEEVFISHIHRDHTGGLAELLKLRSAKICAARLASATLSKVAKPTNLAPNTDIVSPCKLMPSSAHFCVRR